MSIVEDITACRKAIRAHRDAKGDDRCWVDDYAVWSMVDGLGPDLSEPPPYDEAMRRCRSFYGLRRAETPDALPEEAVTDPALWDVDLQKMLESQLAAELTRLQNAIRAHHAQNPPMIDTDRALYSALPENIPADFRLPPQSEFLGEARAPHAGCPSFWRSHAKCKKTCHDMHRWGPCV